MKPLLICGFCNRLRPISANIDNKKQCHNCYEKDRRQKLKVNNPIKYRELNRKHYLKTQPIHGSLVKLSRRLSTTYYAIKNRDPNTNIDKNWILMNIFNKECYYCGIDELKAFKITKNRMHIDRLDPNLGYNKENCVPACKACNTAKLNLWTKDETKLLGQLIRSFYDKR